MAAAENTAPSEAQSISAPPGYYPVNRLGASLARDMLGELDEVCTDTDGETIAERSELEDWAREGRQFRNVVAEYVARTSCRPGSRGGLLRGALRLRLVRRSGQRPQRGQLRRARRRAGAVMTARKVKRQPKAHTEGNVTPTARFVVPAVVIDLIDEQRERVERALGVVTVTAQALGETRELMASTTAIIWLVPASRRSMNAATYSRTSPRSSKRKRASQS